MRLVMEVDKAAAAERGVADKPGAANPRPRVFIVSDVRLYREGLSWNLTREGSLEVEGAFGPSVLALVSQPSQAPDAIIFDIAMPHALQLARELRAAWSNTKIVAFAVSDLDHEIVAGAMAGISGYVHRDGSVSDLVREVLNAVRGELHCSPRLAARLLQQVASLSSGGGKQENAFAEAGEGARPLTPREAQILSLVDKGLSNKEIARALSISFATVKNHVHHILDKLHVRRRTQALARMRKREGGPLPGHAHMRANVGGGSL